ncbi:hypothetical protein N7333_12325 [Pseudomonas sp. GD04158]|uniref:hypothetical protein n=1 Tax=Pseudomonas sp. GD04158 TaxID=2975439 RepID=UPI00244A0565|nr:hypothetical protein [Pseudomonas sp. GD04158]MDH0097362.1 hypothetical protein [Pseudomonas sp. GD04158]
MRRLKQASTLVVDFITNHKLGAGVSLVGGVIGIATALWGTNAPIVIDRDSLQLSFSQPGVRVGESLKATLSSTTELNFKDLECEWHLSPAGFMSITEQATLSDRCTATVKSVSKPSARLGQMGSADAHQTYTVEAVLKYGDSVLGRVIGNLKGINYLTPKTKVTGAKLSISTPVKISLVDANNESLHSDYTCVWPQLPPVFLFEADIPDGCSGTYRMTAEKPVNGNFDTLQIFQNVVSINLDGQRVGVSRFQIPIQR